MIVRLRSRQFWWLTVSVLFAACAISEPPPGGPEDKTPPKVAETDPPNGAAGVPVDMGISFSFSEKMTRGRVERLIVFHPEATVKSAKWDGETIRVTTDQPFHPDTTYVVELQAGFADHHGVRATEGYRFAFATSSAIDSGTIAGRVFFRREPTSSGVSRLWVVPKDSVFAPEATRPDRQVTTTEDGSYRFGYLPTDSKSFLLLAFHDANGNGSLDPEKEYFAVSDTIQLTAFSTSLEARDLYIIDPTEPAIIHGTLVNAAGEDSLHMVVTFHELGDTIPPTYYTRCEPGGGYELRTVLQGTYVVYGFIDVNGDSLCGTYPCPDDSTRACVEPCVQYPDTLVIAPGDRVHLQDMTLEKVPE